jgi:hypothetical protein
MSTHAASAPYGGDPPSIENRKVPLRRANVSYRSREYLSDKEVAALMTAAAAMVRRDYPDTAYVFVSERKAPLCADAVRKIVSRAGREAGIEFPVAELELG